MRFPALLGLLLSYSVAMLAQLPATSVTTPGTEAQQPVTSSATQTVLPELDRLQGISSALNSTISQLKIDKWKADGNSKRQAEANGESIQRNLNSALPGMISSVRSAPQDLAAEFKLYRNINALYDVLSSLAESAGAFGPKNDYEALARQLDSLDDLRRRLGDTLEQLATSNQSQLEQLRAQVRTLQAQASAAPPKKVVVDDSASASKPASTSKKKAKKPAPKADTTTTGTTTSSPH